MLFIMKKIVVSLYLVFICLALDAQVWTIPINTSAIWSINDVVTIDNGNYALGVGCIGDEDGYVMKVSKDGDYVSRTVHASGMMLCYHSVVQLDNGNYMALGVCEDSLCNPDFQRFIRVDVFDSDLEPVTSKMYDVDDDTFDCFAYPIYGLLMRSTLSSSGTIILAAAPSYYVEQYGYYKRAMLLYELDQNGEIIRTKSDLTASVSSINTITYEPHSDNLLIAINGGNFPSCGGFPGIYVVDNNLDLIEKQDLIHIQGGIGINIDNIIEITTDGKWIDGDYMIFNMQKSLQSRSFTYTSLYKVDSALTVYAELELPPYDSCTFMPNGTSTAYINDSTIFVFTYSTETMSFQTHQVNVILVDKELNLLGRKTIKTDDVISYVGPPSALNDGGCLVPFYTCDAVSYQGAPFFQGYLMKFRREDIEITWDVVDEQTSGATISVYPNPTKNILNIPVVETKLGNARLQIIDMKGVKCLDCAITKQGNLISVNVQNLVQGAYVYRVVSNSNEIITGKFIKE